MSVRDERENDEGFVGIVSRKEGTGKVGVFSNERAVTVEQKAKDLMGLTPTKELSGS